MPAMTIHLTPNAVADEAHAYYNPDRFDFRFHDDGSVTITPLLWWDDASYRAYQAGAPDAEPEEEVAGIVRATQATLKPDYDDGLPF